MLLRRTLTRSAALVLGLTAMSAPFPHLAQAQSGDAQAATSSRTLPAVLSDFRCYALLTERRDAFMASSEDLSVQQVEVINNLTIIAAFFAGRITHYSNDEAQPMFDTARAQIAAASAEQRDRLAQACTNGYLGVINYLDEVESTPQ